MPTGPNSLSDTFTQTYNSHGGCDITATINGILLGNLNGISFSTTREKAKQLINLNMLGCFNWKN